MLYLNAECAFTDAGGAARSFDARRREGVGINRSEVIPGLDDPVERRGIVECGALGRLLAPGPKPR